MLPEELGVTARAVILEVYPKSGRAKTLATAVAATNMDENDTILGAGGIDDEVNQQYNERSPAGKQPAR